MKKTIRSIFAMLLVLCMVFTIVGCGEANTESTPNTDDDFFKDTIVDNAGQNDATTSDGTVSNVWRAFPSGLVRVERLFIISAKRVLG